MDIFGITVLAVLTAVGGGILRDVLVGVIPPTTLVHPYGFILSIITSLFVCFLFETVKFSRKGKRIIAIVYNISDTLGLVPACSHPTLLEPSPGLPCIRKVQ